ncbi:hypothetical protein YTPLAS18_06350 [Nitrospira sp.]|nr:hypothetical protein YTPLAS18_06350 [Nitrospira sp.]
MYNFLTRVLVTGVAVFLAIHIVPGIEVRTWSAGLAAVIVLAFLNAIIRPFLYIVSLPIILLTFGLFMVIINAVLLKLAAGLVTDFVITGWWPAIGGAIVISLVSTLLAPWRTTEVHVETREGPRQPPRIVN